MQNKTHPASEAADSLQRGLANRRRVLGNAWVDRSVESANVLNVEFQRMITAYAWDGIWSRPGLERRTRRIMVLAITAAMGRWEEFELHIRTGLQADPADSEAAPLDLDTIREVLLQTAVYAGVPAGNTGMAVTLKVLGELGRMPEAASFAP
ncbi:carboxymuconolactone decarboxylase family protein [Comamonas testosteroni]|uniref:Carboxymuconolactone decarboxylase n=1 Tax=Comamonas testosteroni (strain DSM 14576 / KF-1) TaxID=399795 RepID=B7X360_COMTK|nr:MULTISPECIES: carboxymuconolactone decarboxylase family protein [Comamonas]EED70289.1 Carboxymuconolactone decarboxylase [Comamonas testosteroni KF-1]TYK71294.1 carboxymuconolactone decarboxylase [Comamonas sp. Z3]WQG68215.1 carboxymuconolactone decarboxylase family protein [Comamonas testosteroni]